MTIKKIFNLSVVLILGFILSGCANSQFAKKYNKPFKHNTPLIKDQNIKDSGRSEIAKTLSLFVSISLSRKAICCEKASSQIIHSSGEIGLVPGNFG